MTIEMSNYERLHYSSGDRRSLFEDHVTGLVFEHDLINRKIVWLLTSQSLLFAASA